MFNIHSHLRIVVDLTRPDSPCAIPSHMDPAEEDTSVVFGPMSAPVATIMLSPPKFVVTPLDKADRDIGVVVKSPSVTHVQLAMIEPLPMKHVAVEPAERSIEGFNRSRDKIVQTFTHTQRHMNNAWNEIDFLTPGLAFYS